MTLSTRSFAAISFAGVLIASQPLVAQRSGGDVDPAERMTLLLQNSRRLQVTVELDRQEYFPSEDAVLTIRVKSPVSSVALGLGCITAPDAFAPNAAAISKRVTNLR